MKNTNYVISFIILLFVQLVLTKYCRFGPFVFINILPAMIFCAPTSYRTWAVCLTAFCCGLFVDGLVDGPLGLNAASLVPVAFLQKPLIRFIIDEDVVDRYYGFSFYEFGVVKVGLALLTEMTVFFIIYVAADSAGCRPFWFNATTFISSLAASLVFCTATVNILAPHQKR